jgi:hypothetical protein
MPRGHTGHWRNLPRLSDLANDQGFSAGPPLQVVYSYHRGSRQIEHIGSAHDQTELELLKAVAPQRLAAGQGALDLGPGFGGGGVVCHAQAAPAGLCEESWRHKLAAACAAHAGLGPASLVLYEGSTLSFGAGQGDGFREPALSKERRLEPQITIGLLTDASGSD